jgi:hypothetical protein
MAQDVFGRNDPPDSKLRKPGKNYSKTQNLGLKAINGE